MIIFFYQSKDKDPMCYSGASPHNIPLSMNIQQPSFHLIPADVIEERKVTFCLKSKKFM